MEKQNKRLAVLVGCNYPNTRNELHGCINDVLTMRDTLVSRFGFDPNHIELLTDDGSASVLPTGANIKKALDAMVDLAEPGDVLYFHYSGHGTRIPSLKPGRPFRQDEAIVPCDFNLITDVDFRQLVNRLPKGASFTILSDSCHSGGLIDKEREQIGPSHVTTEISDTLSGSCNKTKAIPFESILEHLTSLTGISTSDIATHFLELFAADMMNPVMTGGKACGAFSNAIEMAFRKHEAPLSNREVVMLARVFLKEQGIEQHPCLYCNDENANATFLYQPAAHQNSSS
ncbi:hypothetical protein ACLB2K_026573 [Fragaria x ananassa]